MVGPQTQSVKTCPVSLENDGVHCHLVGTGQSPTQNLVKRSEAQVIYQRASPSDRKICDVSCRLKCFE